MATSKPQKNLICLSKTLLLHANTLNNSYRDIHNQYRYRDSDYLYRYYRISIYRPSLHQSLAKSFPLYSIECYTKAEL